MTEIAVSAHRALAESSARIGDSIPHAVDLIDHFGYGGARHTVEPIDTLDMVTQANLITAAIARQIPLVHMPVPIERDGQAYFKPLERLALAQRAIPCLGLIHNQDGLDGLKRRIATARNYLANFKVATECGFGRRLKTLRGFTPYEFVCKMWTEQPNRLKLNPSYLMPGPNS